MKSYISILRGINVSGQKKILMADLKALYEACGFSDVLTYIQSGNVLFKADGKLSEHEIITAIENAIFLKYNFQVPVIIRRMEELERALAQNPFLKEEGIDTNRIYFTFLAKDPSESALENLKKYDYPPDRFEVLGRTVYLYCPKDYGNSKLSNNFFESKLKIKATTRNLKTTVKLIELSKETYQ